MKTAGFNLSRHGTQGLLVFAASVSVVLVFLAGCKKAPPPAAAPPSVQLFEVTATNAPASAEIIGQLDSPQNVDVRARVEAFVDKMLFTEGTEVKAEAILFKLDDKPFQERLASAKGQLGEAKASLAKYEKDVARLRPLAEKRAIPQQDLDNALASVDVGKAGVVSAKAKVQSATIDLGYCEVRAPVSGLIGAKQVSVGDLVGKGQPTLLATISILEPMWFYCAVSEVDYLKAQSEAQRTGKRLQELPITLVLANGSEHPDKGKFVFIDRAVDPKTGTLRLRAEFPNPKKTLRPGMFARIKVDLGARPGTIMVPERSLTELQGRNFVWVVGGDNKAVQRPVKVGEALGENVVILDGLKPGERIVAEGLQKVRQDSPVQPLTADQIAQARNTNTLSKTGRE